MDEFGYLSVLLSIILGLSVAQILIGMRGRMLTRRRVREFWPVQLWAAFFFLVSAQVWWAMFGLRNRHDWTFSAFAILLAQVIVLYLATGLFIPTLRMIATLTFAPTTSNNAAISSAFA